MQGHHLHDRATRGEVLTPDEQRELEQWYAQEDRVEGMLLRGSSVGETTTDVQRQVHAALDQLQLVTRQIQELSFENAAERRAIAELRHLLTQRLTTRAA